MEESASYGFSEKINYIAVILRYDSKEPLLVQLNDGNAMEKEYYNLYRNSIQYNLKSDHSYKYYWKDIVDHLSGINSVYLSPDGVYNKINPNIIYDPNTGKYVIDGLDVHYVTNTKDIVQTRRGFHAKSATAKEAQLFGNADFSTVSLEHVDAKTLLNMPPLPGTEKEVIALEAMLREHGWNTTAHKELFASEQEIKKLNSPRVLHVATHGFFLTDKSIIGDHNPLLKSGLLLSNNDIPGTKHLDTDDGVLTAYEAMNLNLENTEW